MNPPENPTFPKPIYTVDRAIIRWRTLQGIGKKSTTLHYHEEIEQIIRKYWPDLQTPVDQVSDDHYVEFAKRIEHYCASRYNGVVSAIRKIVPAVLMIPRRYYHIEPKRIPTPDEFQRLLAALEVANQGQRRLVIRLLAHTGLRIREVRLLRWEHVREDHLFLPGEITKNGKPRCIPFVEGTVEILNALRHKRKYHHDRPAVHHPARALRLSFEVRLPPDGH